MQCQCVEVLKAAAAKRLADADRAKRNPKLRDNEVLLRRQFTALGWAAGELQRHQREKETA